MPGNGHTKKPDDIRRNGHRKGKTADAAETYGANTAQTASSAIGTTTMKLRNINNDE